jgi:Glycosyltransferase family 87
LSVPDRFRKRGLGAAFLLVLAAGMMFYLHQIARPEKAALRGETRFHPTMGDLYSPWRGTQELILGHRDPYGAEVTADIQAVYYGKVLRGAPGEPKDQQRFAYPVYVVFFLFPAVGLPFSTVRVIFWWLLLAITVASVPLWLRLIAGRTSTLAMIVMAAMTVSSVPVVQGLNLQQLGLLVAFLLAGCAALLAVQRYFAAGLVLALAFIKPQMSVLVTAWLVLWALSGWRTRRHFLWGLFGGLAALILGGELLSPGWITRFLSGLVAYDKYTGGNYWLGLMFPGRLSVATAAAAAVVTAVICWRARREPENSLTFAFGYCLLLNITILIIPATAAAFNQVLLLPALLLLVSRWRAVWARNLFSRAACILVATLVVSPWLSAAAVIMVWLLLPAHWLQKVWAAPLYLSLLLPLTSLVGLILLSREVVAEWRPGMAVARSVVRQEL